MSEEIARMQDKCQELTRKIFSSLTAWQVSQLARHPQRPYRLDYVELIFTDFQELHGDRLFGDDQAMVGGLANKGTIHSMDAPFVGAIRCPLINILKFLIWYLPPFYKFTLNKQKLYPLTSPPTGNLV